MKLEHLTFERKGKKKCNVKLALYHFKYAFGKLKYVIYFFMFQQFTQTRLYKYTNFHFYVNIKILV